MKSKRLGWLARSAIAGALASALLPAAGAMAQTQQSVVHFDIPAQPLSDALRAYARQSGAQIIFSEDIVAGVQSPVLAGDYAPEAALAMLLENSGLVARRTERGSIIVLAASDPRSRAATVPADGETNTASASVRTGDASNAGALSAEADILVVGSRTLNTDIRRTEDDIQPYVVLDGDDIRASGAVSVEDYLQTHLPMNAQSSTLNRTDVTGITREGSIDLRGLGINQTLILVDGRRLPSVALGNSLSQPSIVGIPTAAIDRIEILPSTASGAYGGSATGGVINIILKRDYTGLDLNVTYGNTFDTDAHTRDIGVNWGGSFDHGRTHVALSAAWSDGGELYASNRDFAARSGQLQASNDPAQWPYFFRSGQNVCSTAFGYGCNGAPLTLDDGTPLNSTMTFVPAGYEGPVAAGDGGEALLANAGQFDFDHSPFVAWFAPKTESYSLNIRREFTDWLEGYAAYSRSEVEDTASAPQGTTATLAASSPDNPFQQDIFVWVPLGDVSNEVGSSSVSEISTVGAIIRLPFRWSAALDYQYANNERGGASGSLIVDTSAPGVLTALQGAALQDQSAFPVALSANAFVPTSSSGAQTDTVETTSLRFSGPLFDLPGGAVTATALLERSATAIDESVTVYNYFGETAYWTPPASRDVTSEYFEIAAPVFSAENNVPFVHALDLMASVRHDDYETRFSGFNIFAPGADGPFPDAEVSVSKLESTNYTVGLRYAPVADIAFRASYGTGFLPLDLYQFQSRPADIMPAIWLGLFDPLRGDTEVTGDVDGNLITFSSGGGPDLEPEESTSFSYGFIFTPHFLEGLRLSVDVTEIHKTNEIASLYPEVVLANEADLPGRVVRGPNLVGDEPGWAGPIISIDYRPMNFGETDLRAIDVQADYTLETTDMGDWRFYAVATYTDSFTRELLPGTPAMDIVGMFGGPMEWRANFGLDWNGGPWSFGWNAQYYDSYSVCYPGPRDSFCEERINSQGAELIPSQVFHDVRIGYRLEPADSLLSNAELSIGLQNVFDESPAIVASSINVSGYSGFADPRMRRFTIQLRTHF